MSKAPSETWAECWAARVPLKLELAASDVTALRRPPPLYVQARRFSYLPSIAEQALSFFRVRGSAASHVLPPGEDTPWFEYRRLPLPWTVPLGVLVDLLAGEDERPWPLTVHFRAFPAQSLLQWQGRGSLQAAYMNSLKEAAVVCQGSAGAVAGITAGAQRDLWGAVEGGDAHVFRAVCGGLRLTPKARGERPPCIPLRLYVAESDAGYTSNLRESLRHTSRPVRALSPEGAEVTLGAALRELLPGLVLEDPLRGGPSGVEEPAPSPRNDPDPGKEVTNGAEAGEGAAVPPGGPPEGEAQVKGEAPAARSSPAAAGEEGEGEAGVLRVGDRAVVWSICGIRPPLSAPLAWLHANLHQADHFLYIAAVLQR